MNYLDEINSALKEYLPAADDVVSQAMRYSVENGGKRIRPALLLEFCRVCGGDYKKAVAFACALEMIHTYSLIHDDLPCMDNDDFRRGKPSCHIAFGEEYALLAGDALLTLAFETAMKSNLSAEITVKAAKELAKAAGVMGMVGGQVVDVESENLDPSEMTEEKLAFIYEKKTGALIQASLMIGAILAGADDTSVEQMREAGSLLGRAFQIQDDILDMTSSLEVLGKPIGSDERNHKVTYVTLWGMEHAVDEVNRLSQEAVRLLDGFSGDSTFLRDLFCYLIHRER